MGVRLLQGTVAPNLPQAPGEYAPSYFSRFNDVLRLYFNRIDATLAALLDVTGGGLLNNPYGAFFTAASQTLGAADTATVVTLSDTQGANGVSLDGNRIVFAMDGIYKVQYNVQTANSSASIQDATVWLRKNGTDIPHSAHLFTITEKHGGIDGRVDQQASFGFVATAGDYVELMWAATSTAVTLYYEPAQTVPYAHPSVPSTYVTVSFISAV